VAAPLRYVRVYADPTGESHIAFHELSLSGKSFAPPAPPLDVSAHSAASAFALLRLPAAWWGEWHPSPYRQWLFFMTGTAIISVSDGEHCEVRSGSIVLLEDIAGKGHQTRVTGGNEVIIASVTPRDEDDA
jgi:hypothetical protein